MRELNDEEIIDLIEAGATRAIINREFDQLRMMLFARFVFISPETLNPENNMPTTSNLEMAYQRADHAAQWFQDRCRMGK